MNEVGPVTRALLDAGTAEGWFFIRYGDPEWHVRWRLRGDPEKLARTALPAVQAAAARLVLLDFLGRTYQSQLARAAPRPSAEP